VAALRFAELAFSTSMELVHREPWSGEHLAAVRKHGNGAGRLALELDRDAACQWVVARMVEAAGLSRAAGVAECALEGVLADAREMTASLEVAQAGIDAR
jgi:hypothetical protein